MLFESTSGMPGHTPDIASPSAGGGAVRVLVLRLAGLVLEGLPMPRLIAVTADTGYADVTFTRVEDLYAWAEALGSPEVDVFTYRHRCGGVTQLMVSTSAEIPVGGGATVRLDHRRPVTEACEASS
jgi:hypothetical protein